MRQPKNIPNREFYFYGLILLIPLGIALLTLSGVAGIQAAPLDNTANLTITATPTSTPNPAIGMPSTPCENGLAGPFPCNNVDFLSFMTNEELGAGTGEEAANLWGWTDPATGVEYVIFGTTDLTAFVDISDPENPVLIGTLPSETIPSNKYRDVKVYQDYAFIIADLDSQHGMQVFDLTQLRDIFTPTVTLTATAHYTGFGNSHNIFINEESGFAYAARTTNLCSEAIAMVNVQDPLNPVDAGCVGYGGLASDSICVNYHGPDPMFQNHEVCIVASDDNIVIADVTDKANPLQIKELTYTDITRAHNAWVTEDHRYFVSADMNDELMHGYNTRIFIWDFSDIANTSLVGIYTGPTPGSDHNIWIRDKQAYIGNFRAGVRILDLFNISNGELTEGGYFDMVPVDDNTGHSAGAWAVYPYFESGVIAVSEKPTGLYLLKPNLNVERVWFPIVQVPGP